MKPEVVRVRLEPLGTEIEAARNAPLQPFLAAQGVEFPCGGEGICGSCRVRVLSGWLPINESDYAHLSEQELADGWRLACHARVTGPLTIECGQWRMEVLADASRVAGAGKRGLGIAIDLGTTTIAAQMIDRCSGEVLALETMLNPQSSWGSDVMSRIRAVLAGQDLTAPIRAALGDVVGTLAGDRRGEVTEVVLVGNTVMHHLFCGFDVTPLSRVPFASQHLGEQHFRGAQLGWALPEECEIRVASCIGGFVGADILAGIIAVGMAESDELMALIDLGTNGEIAMGNRRGIVCASTAAGPAFEAGAIRMGMRAVSGAISHLSYSDGKLQATVIGNGTPRGICGSGLVDAVAAGLRSGSIHASGRIADGSRVFPVADPVVLYQSDVRELQLAKGAIAAGFNLLLRQLGVSADQLKDIHLAGAFGNYVQIDSAIRIGLFAAPKHLIRSVGNTALRGAKWLLMRDAPPLPAIEHLSLAADPGFQQEFAECMMFPQQQDLKEPAN